MQLDDVTLPDDLLWTNEFDWNPVEQHIDRSLNGALLIQEQLQLYGRAITLSGGQEAGWVKRSTVASLLALNLVPNRVMALILPDGRQFSVIFDRKNGSPIQAQQILPFAYPDDHYQYSLTLHLLTVEAPTG